MLGDITRVQKAKIAVYTCPFDAMNTETKGTVLIKSAEELKSFSKGEEELIESVITVVKQGVVSFFICCCFGFRSKSRL